MEPSVPKELYDETSDLYSIFLEIGKGFGDSREMVDKLIRLLPKQIKEATTWHDRIIGLWRYEYGLPYDSLYGDQIAFGTDQFPEVKNLYYAIRVADKYLTNGQLERYIQRLEDRSRHQDVLFEMRPLIEIDNSVSASYEVEGYGEGNKTIDWLIEYEELKILFDVKHRIKSLIDHLGQIISGINQGERNILPQPPDPSVLFKNTLSKFGDRLDGSFLQGVWIKTGIKEDENKLRTCFNNLDHNKLQFAIISDWKDDAYFMVRDNSQKEILKDCFRLCESNRFVSNEYPDN